MPQKKFKSRPIGSPAPEPEKPKKRKRHDKTDLGYNILNRWEKEQLTSYEEVGEQHEDKGFD